MSELDYTIVYGLLNYLQQLMSEINTMSKASRAARVGTQEHDDPKFEFGSDEVVFIGKYLQQDEGLRLLWPDGLPPIGESKQTPSAKIKEAVNYFCAVMPGKFPQLAKLSDAFLHDVLLFPLKSFITD